MSTPTPPPDPHPPEADHWARPIDRLKVSDVPTGALNLNVNGREVVSPRQGFGPLWQKTYRVRLAGATVAQAPSLSRTNDPLYVWHNAIIRTFFYELAASVRRLAGLFKH